MSLKLYDLVAQHRELQQVAEDSEADPQAVLDTIEGLSGEIELKSQSVAMVILNIESVAEAIDEAAKAMRARAAALRNRADGIRLYLQLNMQAAGITRIECPYMDAPTLPSFQFVRADRIRLQPYIRTFAVA
jgi:hypothetical protein